MALPTRMATSVVPPRKVGEVSTASAITPSVPVKVSISSPIVSVLALLMYSRWAQVALSMPPMAIHEVPVSRSPAP